MFTKEELIDTVKELSLKCFNKTQEYLSLKERADSLETNTITMESQYKQLRVRNNTPNSEWSCNGKKKIDFEESIRSTRKQSQSPGESS